MKDFWTFLSSKANWDPVKTIFLCIPAEYAADKERIEEFAEESGWKQQAESDAALLIVPMTDDWGKESLDRIPEIYNASRNSFKASGGISTPGRDGIVWTWETLIFLVGYDDGADYAGNVLVKHPNKFAAAVLIDGCSNDFSHGNELSDHWLVKNPSSDYQVMNKEIPSAVWMFGGDYPEATHYFAACDGASEHITAVFDGIHSEVYLNPSDPVQEVRVSSRLGGVDKRIAEASMHLFFNHVIRWKNSPDGQIRYRTGKEEFYSSKKYDHASVSVGGNAYPYAVYNPKKSNRKKSQKPAVVLSLHGRGEPAWVFAEKNGWEALADETGEFIAVLPDSPFNSWFIERDRECIERIINETVKKYNADRSRVYITGFSNGAIFTNQMMSAEPQFFAAASPWNGPGIEACRTIMKDSFYYDPGFEKSGYDMPIWICVGDSDNKASADREDELDIMLKVNQCDRASERLLNGINCYTAAEKYKEGNRFHTRIFSNNDGSIRVGLTIMKNMPHGAIWDESRAAWNFMKRFKRSENAEKVIEIREEEQYE